MLERLVKEKKVIIPTYTKYASRNELESERIGYEYLQAINIPAPRVVHMSKTCITTEMVPGISVFRAISLLNQKGDHKRIHALVRHLGDGVRRFQQNSGKLNVQHAPYDIRHKLNDVLAIMRKENKPYVSAVQKALPWIIDSFLQEATVPFRDATPKNYLLEDVNDHDVSVLSARGLCKRVRWIDLRSVSEYTMPQDDFISIIYHYNVPKPVRTNFVKRYLTPQDISFVLSAFVRMGRLWVRRYYYRRYQKKLFPKRYRGERLHFYDRHIDAFTKALIQYSP